MHGAGLMGVLKQDWLNWPVVLFQVEVWINTVNHNNEGSQYKTQIQAYDTSGDLITYCDTSTTLKWRLTYDKRNNNGIIKWDIHLLNNTI